MISEFIEKGLIKQGEFVLKSGEKSNMYIDLKSIISYPELHKKVCDELIKKFNPDLKYNTLCGTPYGALPFTSYISISENIPMVLLRKEKKKYGTCKRIEGVYNRNNKVILLEDVITTGESVDEAAQILENFGLEIVQIISVFSRSKHKNLKYNHIPIEYLYHSDDIKFD